MIKEETDFEDRLNSNHLLALTNLRLRLLSDFKFQLLFVGNKSKLKERRTSQKEGREERNFNKGSASAVKLAVSFCC